MRQAVKRAILVLGITLALEGLLTGVAFAQADVPTRIAAFTGTWEGYWQYSNPYGSGSKTDSSITVGQFVKDADGCCSYTAP